MVEAAWVRIERSAVVGRTVTLKLRYSDFRTITRARSCAQGITDRATFLAIGASLLDQQLPIEGGVRLLGLTLSGLTTSDPGEGEPAAIPVQVELPL